MEGLGLDYDSSARILEDDSVRSCILTCKGTDTSIRHSIDAVSREVWTPSDKSGQPDLVLPFVTLGGREIAGVRAVFRTIGTEARYRKVPFAYSSVNGTQLETDKGRLMTWLREHGLAALAVREWDLEVDSADSVPMPVVVKPRWNSGGSVGVSIVYSSAELVHSVGEAGGGGKVIVQEALSHPLVWTAHIAARHGVLVGASFRRYGLPSSELSGTIKVANGAPGFGPEHSRWVHDPAQ